MAIVALVAALLPIAPTPLDVAARHTAPRFFASGAWRRYIRTDSTIGLLPFSWQSDLDMMQWQTEQGLHFKILNGYFLGPNPSRHDKQGQFGGGGASLVRVLLSQHLAGDVHITGQQRIDCLHELRSWHAAALVLPDNVADAAGLRGRAAQILGPPTRVGGIWLWRLGAAR